MEEGVDEDVEDRSVISRTGSDIDMVVGDFGSLQVDGWKLEEDVLIARLTGN